MLGGCSKKAEITNHEFGQSRSNLMNYIRLKRTDSRVETLSEAIKLLHSTLWSVRAACVSPLWRAPATFRVV